MAMGCYGMLCVYIGTCQILLFFLQMIVLEGGPLDFWNFHYAIVSLGGSKYVEFPH